MKTKTPEQLNNQWMRISGYVRQRGDFVKYFYTYVRYSNRMAEYLGASPYWHPRTGFQYTKESNAPTPRNVYAGY